MVTVRPGEGVYQDSRGRSVVRRDGKFVPVTTPIKVVRPGFTGGKSKGRSRSSGRPPGEKTAQRQASGKREIVKSRKCDMTRRDGLLLQAFFPGRE